VIVRDCQLYTGFTVSNKTLKCPFPIIDIGTTSKYMHRLLILYKKLRIDLFILKKQDTAASEVELHQSANNRQKKKNESILY